MNGNVRGTTIGDRIWRCCDILIMLIFWIGLGRIRLRRGLFAKVCIGHRQLWIFNSLHKIFVDIFDLDLILGGWIGDGLQCTSLACLGFFVRMNFTGSLLPLLVLELVKFSKLRISISFVLVQILDEGFNIWNLVLPTVIASRRMLCGTLATKRSLVIKEEEPGSGAAAVPAVQT